MEAILLLGMLALIFGHSNEGRTVGLILLVIWWFT